MFKTPPLCEFPLYPAFPLQQLLKLLKLILSTMEEPVPP